MRLRGLESGVMFIQTGLILGSRVQDFQAGAILLTQEQWIGVLKLSTAWNMKVLDFSYLVLWMCS